MARPANLNGLEQGHAETHELRVVDASEIAEVSAAVRKALNGGPAVVPKDARAARIRTPTLGSGAELPTQVTSAVAVVIETSGSSGTPKRVALSRDALVASGEAAHHHLGGHGQWLLALPLTYIAGISVLVRSVLADTEPVILSSGHFHPPSFVDSVRQLTGERRYTSLVPVQLARLVEFAEDSNYRATGGDIAELDAILIGGQALEPTLAARAQALGWNVVATYGSSETAGGCVYDGVALRGVDVKIGDRDTREVWIGGPTLALGYLGDTAQTADRFVTQGATRWYRTGDSAEVVDGRLQILGRLDRVIISGGLKVSLEAVEAAARSVESAGDAVAVSIPDSEWGQSPALIVPGIPATPEREDLDDQLYEAVVAALGRAAAPRIIRHVESLPRLSNGKVDLLAVSQILRESGE